MVRAWDLIACLRVSVSCPRFMFTHTVSHNHQRNQTQPGVEEKSGRRRADCIADEWADNMAAAVATRRVSQTQ